MGKMIFLLMFFQLGSPPLLTTKPFSYLMSGYIGKVVKRQFSCSSQISGRQVRRPRLFMFLDIVASLQWILQHAIQVTFSPFLPGASFSLFLNCLILVQFHSSRREICLVIYKSISSTVLTVCFKGFDKLIIYSNFQKYSNH